MRYLNETNVPYYEKTNKHLLLLLDQLLESIPGLSSFVVTSTWRSPEHNNEVGGVPDSYHLIGAALDIQFSKYISLPKMPGLKIINYPLKGYSHVQLPERPVEETQGSSEIGFSESYPSLSIRPVTGLICGFLIITSILYLLLKK